MDRRRRSDGQDTSGGAGSVITPATVTFLRWLDRKAERAVLLGIVVLAGGHSRSIAVFSEAAGTLRWALVTGTVFLFLDAALQFVVKLFV